MVITTILVGYSIISGIMASLLIIFSLFFEKDKKKSRNLLIWSALFLANSFAISEYAFWQEGYNLFTLVFSFNFPLIVYFAIWFGFLIWIFELRKERKIWIILLVLLIITILIAMSCMNCIRI
jgi:glucan phosphoethanolaminetransferase (alkaline phosphatase superfamily)